MSKNPRSKSTATAENALDSAEVDAFLEVRQDARMGTNRGDGWWHLTPIWYAWDGTRFRHTLGAGRRHLRNLRNDPHVTLCVDEDPRLTEGLAAGARSVVCFGSAELSTDEQLVRDVTWEIIQRYLGDDASQYIEPILAEGRTIVTVTPQHWLTWDYNKG
jgi:PPOX class probable F420-dependent enzyme